MAYAAEADLTARFGGDALLRVTDIGDVATGTVDSAKVTAALSTAENLINSFLQGKVALPLATADTPAILTDHACALAWAELVRRAGLEDDGAESGARNAKGWLRDFAAGRVSLGLDAGSSVVATDNDIEAVAMDGGDVTKGGTFTATKLKGFF